MAATITVSCPGCKKTIQAPANLQGKRIRCKGCGQTFPVVPMKSEAKKDDEWGIAKAYGVDIEKEVLRCPFCAHEMEDETAIICLHCGYNLQTRQRIETKVLVKHTQQDYLMHLMPGIINAVVVLINIGLIIWVWVDFWWDLGDPWTMAAKVYFTVMFGFIMWYTGYYAFQRLVLNPHPPERRKTE